MYKFRRSPETKRSQMVSLNLPSSELGMLRKLSKKKIRHRRVNVVLHASSRWISHALDSLI